MIDRIMKIITGYLRDFSPISFWTFSDLAARSGFCGQKYKILNRN